MATKVSKYQIAGIDPSQINMQGAIRGDTLVAVSASDGLTLTWAPTSILPRYASHGQVLAFDYYTLQWKASSIGNVAGTGQLPSGFDLVPGSVLIWNGATWSAKLPEEVVVDNQDGVLSVQNNKTSTPTVSTSKYTINVNTIPVSKLNQSGAAAQQVLTWNTNTNTWSPSSLPPAAGYIRAWVCFNGTNGTIYSSRNVTSVTYVGTGSYRINFATNTVSTTGYAFTCGHSLKENPITSATNTVDFVLEGQRTTTYIDVKSGYGVGAGDLNDGYYLRDCSRVSIAIIN